MLPCNLFDLGFREKVDALRKMFGQMGAVAGDQVVPSFTLFPSKLFPKSKTAKCPDVAILHLNCAC